jgi:transposase
MRRKPIPDAEIFASAIQDEISRSPQGRYFHRLHVVLHVLKGVSTYEAARLYGDSPRSVQYWIQRLLTSGLPGLWDGKRPGRPVQISHSHRENLRKEIRRSPRQFRYGQNLWDGPLLSHHLKEKYNISLGVRQCQRLFHQLGFSLQRPRRTPSEADPFQQEEFKKTSTDG